MVGNLNVLSPPPLFLFFLWRSPGGRFRVFSAAVRDVGHSALLEDMGSQKVLSKTAAAGACT